MVLTEWRPAPVDCLKDLEVEGWALWVLERREFTSRLQWLPLEMMEDLFALVEADIVGRIHAVEICKVAARVGRLDWLVNARAQDPPCPWSEWTCAVAATCGHLEILKWLRAQNPPCPWNKGECIEHAGRNGHHEVVAWLRAQPE